MVLIAAALGIASGFASIHAIWEGWMTDRLLQLRAAVEPLPQDRFPVAVVGLDQASLTSKRLEAIPRVFMSQAFAEAGSGLFDAGAKAIGLDFVFAFSADSFADPQTGERGCAAMTVSSCSSCTRTGAVWLLRVHQPVFRTVPFRPRPAVKGCAPPRSSPAMMVWCAATDRRCRWTSRLPLWTPCFR
ncbi:CHASE2 domain-containing protein [Pannonibacter sp. Pt2-lr]